MNITKHEVLHWDGFQAVIESFKSEFSDCARGDDGRVRFTIEPHRFLDILEVPAGEEFKTYRNTRLSNTSCLALVKTDCTELMFVKRKMTAAGDYKLKTYVFGKSKLLNSDIDLLKKLKFGDESSFDDLFDTKDIVKRFYREYKVWLERLDKSIEGIGPDDDRRHYSQILLSRMMFLYFIQTKSFLSDERNYLTEKWIEIKRNKGNFYRDFLLVLFFKVLNTRKEDRETTLFKSVPFLNGGLFKEHDIERTYDIQIGNGVLGNVLEFLDGWLWYVDETTDYDGGAQSINPEILGHIFEKTITDQNKKGAYYTPIDVTGYICDETIIPYCIQQVNKRFLSKYEKMSEIWENIKHSEYLYFNILRKIRILDPSCGSGEFLLTSSKILFELYIKTWKTIESRKSNQVKQEQGCISGCPEYYFKRLIVTENLYGVDIENGALEICKLRLWLSLVSAMSRDTADPLPNIDYNIMQGNSLIGYTDIPEKQQYSIDNPYDIEDILRNVDQLKDAYNAETDPQAAAHLRKTIEQMVKPCNDLLNSARASDIAVGEALRPTAKCMKEINPFHWRLHFHEAVTAGGFDIIVGNPPYGADIDYPTAFLKTAKTKNSFAFFIEVSMCLLKPSGRIGYIVPVSGISTANMKPLQKILLTDCSELKISNYDDRPGKLFEGLEHCRSSIILGTKRKGNGSSCAVFTTGYNRWYAPADRGGLFGRIRNNGYVQLNFTPSDSHPKNTIESFAFNMGTIPKFQNKREKQILTKILRKPPLRQSIRQKSDFVVYYHNAPQYWIRAMNVPMLRKTLTQSSHVKSVYLKNERVATVTLALLNSSLFYWFHIKTSNCRDLNFNEIENFRIDADEFAPGNVLNLSNLTHEMLKNYKKNSKIKTSKRKKKTVRHEEAYPKHAKSIIDKIDDILARHFGFTQNEAVFIKEFDKEFRMRDN